MTGIAAIVARRRGGDGSALPQVLPSRRLGGPMPWLIAIMALLTVLATGGALALLHFASAAQDGLAGRATVSVVAADPAKRAAETRAASAALAGAPGVGSVAVVPQEEVAQLARPWLGTLGDARGIALPALIDVEASAAIDSATLADWRARLARAAPSATIEAQDGWLGPVFAAVRALRWLAFALIALLLAASMAAVWLAARNALDANRETIAIVHQLGARDDQIARLFQRSVLVDALAGALLGLVAGGAALMLLGTRFAALNSGLVAGSTLGVGDWLLIALVPAIMTGVAVATARWTVLAQLEKSL